MDIDTSIVFDDVEVDATLSDGGYANSEVMILFVARVHYAGNVFVI